MLISNIDLRYLAKMFKQREVEKHIEANLFKDKVILLFGARRTGKTTLVQRILDNHSSDKKIKYWSCEDFEIRKLVETTNFESLRKTFSPYDLVVLDEAQSVENIGLVLKIIHDHIPKTQVIATGSSSFDLLNKVGEPLVGRSRTYNLYPFSLSELGMDFIQLNSNLEHFLRFGFYPTVVGKSEKEASEELIEIKNGYLYKDILAIEGIKNSKILINLLIALALQIGSEVSYNELASNLCISVTTVQKYIDLLEKCFIIFVLPAFSRNLRKEVGLKSRKIYFCDIGIRNAIINSFFKINMRADVGGLWENFCIVELMKKASNARNFSNNYFWRTYDQQEIDFIQEYDGLLHAFEFKYSSKQKVKIPKIFAETYPNEFNCINRENFQNYLLSDTSGDVGG